MKSLLLLFFLVVFTSCSQKSNDSSPPSTDTGNSSTKKITPHTFQDYEFVSVSTAASPEASYAIHNDGQLLIKVRAAHFNNISPSVKLGILHDSKNILSSAKAKVTERTNYTEFLFKLDNSAIQNDQFKMAFEATWYSKELKINVRQERYLHKDIAAAHTGISKNTNNWITIRLKEYKQIVSDNKNEINLKIDQPLTGKMTLVIEDLEGKRIRNLISGVKTDKGSQKIQWDGTDDDGNLVKPGQYTWRSIHHPGIIPNHQLTIANGNLGQPKAFGTNHGTFTDAVSNKDYAFIAAPLTEGGWSMIAVDENGKWQKGFQQIHGTPIHAVKVAVSDKYFYAIHDGLAWGEKVDKTKPGWVSNNYMTVTRFDINSTQYKSFPGNKKFLKFGNYEFGPGAKDARFKNSYSIAGAAYLKGILYLTSKHDQKLHSIDAEKGEIINSITVKKPGPLTTDGNRLFVVVGDSLVAFSPGSNKKELIIKKSGLDIQGVTIADDGKIYLTDGRSHTVKAFTAKGKPLGSIGISGGNYKGPYVAERLVNPRGLTMHKNNLWITEERWNTKRVSAWDIKTKKVKNELFGNPHYGSSGGGFDTEDHTKWIALNSIWNVDFKNKKSKPTSIMGLHAGRLDGHYHEPFRYTYYRQDGRTFLLTHGKVAMICELMKDGSVKDHAAVANMHMFAYAFNWKLPQPLRDALPKKYDLHAKKKFQTHQSRFIGAMWVDKNGDGKMQKEEFNFSDDYAGFSNFWGNNQTSLSIRLPISKNKGIPRILLLKPNGFHPGGAPNYPSLNKAIQDSVAWQESVKLKSSDRMPTTVDRKDNLIYNTDPNMVAVSPKGKILWKFPNQWVGVHGSHKAPLPEVGVMQGNLFFLGCAPLDKESDVFVLNGNHGRFSVMTSDGLYLDEMFRDCRIGRERNYMMIGGEPFGGVFGKSNKDGNYYLQTSGDGYRIYTLKGLDKIVRQSGKFEVNKDQIMAAERNYSRAISTENEAREANIYKSKKSIKIDGKTNDWERSYSAEWDKSGLYKVKVRVTYDTENLYLNYHVSDDTPWVNNGNDWTTLFKTGDSVDIKLGLDSKAKDNRRSPVEKDIRLLIGQFNKKPIAVLYKHRLKKKNNPVTFTSPWRSETVDSVVKINDAQIKVNLNGNSYEIEAAIPIKSLGVNKLSGLKIKGDFGVVYGDDKGTINFLRNYWSNKATGLVNDVPGEIMLSPVNWGTIKFK